MGGLFPVNLSFARRVDGDNYVVQYREIRGDLIERFVTAKVKERRVRAVRRGRRRGGPQNLELF